MQVRATKQMKKGTLRLAPVTQKLDQRPSVGSIGLGTYKVGDTSADFKVFISPHMVVPKLAQGGKQSWVAPFWCVQTTDKDEEINMELEWCNYSVEGVVVRVPQLKNTRDLEKDELLLFKSSKGTTVPEPPVDQVKPRGQKRPRVH